MRPVEIGQILILREEFRKVATNPKQPGGLVVRAEILVRLLDELTERREKEAAERGESEHQRQEEI